MSNSGKRGSWKIASNAEWVGSGGQGPGQFAIPVYGWGLYELRLGSGVVPLRAYWEGAGGQGEGKEGIRVGVWGLSAQLRSSSRGREGPEWWP